MSGLKTGCLHQEVPLFGPGVTRWKLLQIFLAEIIGTGTLLFLGCMGALTGLSPLGICISVGLIVSAVIQTFGHISLALINPAISLAAVVLGKISAPLCGVYCVAQCIGAILGYGLLLVITPYELRRGGPGHACTIPHPDLNTWEALAIEFLCTAILIFLLCGCWDKRNANNLDSLPLKFGFAVTALALAGGQAGISMNSVRSLGPAVWHGCWDRHWIYWVGPLSAAVLVSTFYRLIFDRDDTKEFAELHEHIPLNDPGKRPDANDVIASAWDEPS